MKTREDCGCGFSSCGRKMYLSKSSGLVWATLGTFSCLLSNSTTTNSRGYSLIETDLRLLRRKVQEERCTYLADSPFPRKIAH